MFFRLGGAAIPGITLKHMPCASGLVDASARSKLLQVRLRVQAVTSRTKGASTSTLAQILTWIDRTYLNAESSGSWLHAAMSRVALTRAPLAQVEANLTHRPLSSSFLWFIFRIL